MLNMMKAALTTAVVGIAATAAWAVVVEPILNVTAPSQVKVGDQFSVHVHAINPAPMPPDVTLHVSVHIQLVARNGQGKGRVKDIFADIDNHEFIDIEIPVRASGWASGAIVVTEATTMGPDGMESVSDVKMVQFVKGNGSPK